MKTQLQTHRNEITCNRNFEGLTVGTTQYYGAGGEEVHCHESPTICFLLSGGGVEKRSRTIYERFDNDARFYHAAEPHQSGIRVFPSKCLNLEFEADFLRHYAISENAINLAVAESPDVKFTMLKIYREFQAGDALAQTSIEMLLFALLDGKKVEPRKKTDWMHKLHDLLNDLWSEQPTLNELAAAVNIHPVTISKHFTKYFSCTFGEYMRKLKIDRSLFLIRNSELSLTEIALQCGFADQSHFTRNFKEQTGFLPKDFRRL